MKRAANEQAATDTEAEAAETTAGAEAPKHEKRQQNGPDSTIGEPLVCASHYLDVNADYIYRIADKSFQMEVDRYESLSATSARLATCISILAVALLAVIDLLCPVFVKIGMIGAFAIAGLIIGLLLLLSLTLAVCSQFRFRYDALASPREYADSVQRAEELDDAVQAATRYAGRIDEVYVSLRKRNDSIRTLIGYSLVALMLAIAVMFVAIFFLSGSLFGCWSI